LGEGTKKDSAPWGKEGKKAAADQVVGMDDGLALGETLEPLTGTNMIQVSMRVVDFTNL